MNKMPDRIWATPFDSDMDGGTYCDAAERPTSPNHDAWCYVRADIVQELTAERDEAINQLDSAIHSQIVLEKRTAAVMEDRRLILEERDRTFALMLARAEKAELERDALREDLEELDFLRHEGGPDSVAAMEVELKRLREALEQFLIEYDVVDLADAEPSSLTAAVLAARAALKGEVQ